MEAASAEYLFSGSNAALIATMDEYIRHVTEHLWKENDRLFAMAEAGLQHVASQVCGELDEIEAA